MQLEDSKFHANRVSFPWNETGVSLFDTVSASVPFLILSVEVIQDRGSYVVIIRSESSAVNRTNLVLDVHTDASAAISNVRLSMLQLHPGCQYALA